MSWGAAGPDRPPPRPGLPPLQGSAGRWTATVHSGLRGSAPNPDRGSLSLAATLNVGEHRRGWAAYSAAIGLALLAPIATFVAPPGATVIYVAATLGWTWTSAVMTHLFRVGSRGGG